MTRNSELPAVILAGGLGTRLREETEFRPKPLVEIGGKPILWHIMKTLGVQGVEDFTICLGYKSDSIKDYFLNYQARMNDLTIHLGETTRTEHLGNHDENWKVTLAQTGALTNTGGRVKAVERYVAGRRFLCTYGDGVANIDLDRLLDFHLNHGKIATVSTYRPISRFGALEINDSGVVTSFSEKPQSEGWVNAGYFIFEPEVFEYLESDSILETAPLQKLSGEGELMAFKHEGFWQPMDTFRETMMLNEMWEQEKAPWKIW